MLSISVLILRKNNLIQILQIFSFIYTMVMLQFSVWSRIYTNVDNYMMFVYISGIMLVDLPLKNMLDQ